MFKYAALISYVGTGFCGWQRQAGKGEHGNPSIQQTLEAALTQVTGEARSVVGSGRTDSGVHSMGQVAHFVLKEREFDCTKLAYGLNSVLPLAIRILKIKRVAIEFHAQRSATQKQYSYYFQQGPSSVPHLEHFSRWIRKPLDLGAMNLALAHLIGEHDFKGFQGSGGIPGSTVRTIHEAGVSLDSVPFPGNTPIPSGPSLGLIRMKVVGTGFLKYMVRGIAGTVLQIGEGRRDPSVILEILKTQDRNLVGPTAPAKALWLERVWYPEIEW